MGRRPQIKTERETWIEERIFNLGCHYRTTISDGTKKAVARGNTPEESQRKAMEKWAEGKTESQSGCYLTTACIEAMHYPDNCFELEVLRGFRDKILMPDPLGKRAVREYYRIAPEIVQSISEQNNAKEIWQGIYRDIRYAVSLILSGDFEGAFKHYQQMTLRLKRKYLD